MSITYNQSGVQYNDQYFYDGTSVAIVRTATGTATGSGTATAKEVLARWARSFITVSETATAIPVRVRTASNSGLGASATTRVLVALRTASNSGTGSEASVGARTIRITGTDAGAGSGTASFVKSLIFRPPVDSGFRWAEYFDDSPDGLWGAKLQKGARASNVYRLKNGTYTTVDPLNPDDVQYIYLGGHNNVVSEQEKADLVAAGYTVS